MELPWFPPLVLAAAIALTNDVLQPDYGRLLPIVGGMAALCVATEAILAIRRHRRSSSTEVKS